MSTELSQNTQPPPTTYFVPLLILFVGLIFSAGLQIAGLITQQAQLAQTKTQLEEPLAQAKRINKFSEDFFQDIVILAPHNATAARLQTAYNIRVKGQPIVPTPTATNASPTKP